MKKLAFSVVYLLPAAAFAGDGAAAPSDGLRDGILQALHMIGHALGLI